LEAETRKYDIYFIALIAIILAIRLLVIGLSLISPQEAYYWNYAQHPDWSYFDHPAAASLLIKFGTILFGINSFGVRFGGVILSAIMAIITYLFVKKIFSSRVAFYSTLLLNVIWIFSVGAVITTPDNPLFFFWVLNIVLIYYAAKNDSLPFYLLWGLSAGLGFCSKYTMVMAFPSAFLYLLIDGKLKQIRTWFYFCLGCLMSLISAFPVLYWNYLHNWASFAFQTTRRAQEMSTLRLDMFFGFLGTQLAVISPFILPFVIYAVYKSGAIAIRHRDNRYNLLFSYALPVLLLFTLTSFRGWVKMNWPTLGYYSAIIAMCAIFEDKIKPKPRWMNRGWRKYALFGVSFSILLSALTYIHGFFPIIPMGSADTTTGWKDLGKIVGYYTNDFIPQTPNNIIGYEYKIASEAAFYTPGNPDTKSDNFVGEHGLSYRYWANPNDYIGDDFLFLYDSRHWYKPEDKLLNYFDFYVPEKPLKIYGITGKMFYFHIIRCYGYKGVGNTK